VDNVAGHDRQTVNDRSRGNQGIAVRARIRNVKAQLRTYIQGERALAKLR
jgi:hypothetical protein